MQHIDMHCDSLMMLLMQDREKADLYSSPFTHVDIKRMKQGGQMAQFFAAFLIPAPFWSYLKMDPMDDDEYIRTLHDYLIRNVEAHSDEIAMACSADDIVKNYAAGKTSAVFTIEDGRSVNGDLNKLKTYYDMGVRALSLTWNAPNCFGAPNSLDPAVMKTGLTDFGKEAVSYMQELGMLVDVSHLSEGGFYDVAKVCKKPFAATHSNAMALCPHQRGLTDDQLRVLGNAGGVTGLNFGPEFLNQDITCKDSTAALLAKHARHIANVGGIDCVGIGSDFDGIEGNIEVEDCSKLYLLEDALKKEGFSENEVEKIFYKNVLRVLKDAL